MIVAREFTSAAELRAHAAAVHQRCFNPQISIARKTEPEPAAEVVYGRFFAKQLPSWESGMLTFDAHVVAYRVAQSISSFSVSGEVRTGGPTVRRSIETIVREVLEQFPGVTIDNIQSIRRTHDIIPARRVAMFEVYMQRPDLSLPMIARWFRKDHTSVLYNVGKEKSLRGIA